MRNPIARDTIKTSANRDRETTNLVFPSVILELISEYNIQRGPRQRQEINKTFAGEYFDIKKRINVMQIKNPAARKTYRAGSNRPMKYSPFRWIRFSEGKIKMTKEVPTQAEIA